MISYQLRSETHSEMSIYRGWPTRYWNILLAKVVGLHILAFIYDCNASKTNVRAIKRPKQRNRRFFVFHFFIIAHTFFLFFIYCLAYTRLYMLSIVQANTKSTFWILFHLNSCLLY